MSDDAAQRNLWQQVLEQLKHQLDREEFRRWFESTAYASDAGDHITVWTPSESVRRHLVSHYQDVILSALATAGRRGVTVRFVVSGFEEDDEDE